MHERGHDVGPDAVGLKVVVPGAHGLLGAELLRQEALGAAHLLQIQARVDHLAEVNRQRGIAARERLNHLPLRLRQINRVAPAGAASVHIARLFATGYAHMTCRSMNLSPAYAHCFVSKPIVSRFCVSGSGDSERWILRS